MTTTAQFAEALADVWMTADADRKAAQKALDAAKDLANFVIAQIEVDLFGAPLTDEQKAAHTSENPIEVEGYLLSYRDYGKCSMAPALAELFGWIGQSKTFTVSRIIDKWADLQKKHTRPSWKGTLKAQ